MAVVAVMVVLVVAMRTFSADVYDAIITQKLTTPWYRAVLTRLSPVRRAPTASTPCCSVPLDRNVVDGTPQRPAQHSPSPTSLRLQLGGQLVSSCVCYPV